MYKIKSLIEKGLDITKLPENKQKIISAITTLSENYTINNEKAQKFDDILVQWINQEMPEILPKETVKKIEVETIEEKHAKDIEFVRGLALTSSGFSDYAKRFTEAILGDGYKELQSALSVFYDKIDSTGLKLCMAFSYMNFGIVGGGNIEDYIPDFDKVLRKYRALGLYIGGYNIIYMPSSEEDFDVLIDNATRYYGIDAIFAKENVNAVLLTVFIHECIHAFLHSQNKSSSYCEDKPEIKSFKTMISQAFMLNKLALEFLQPLIKDGASWQEMITHIVSNKKYYGFVEQKGYQIHLNKIMMICTDDDFNKKTLIDVINEFTKYAFSKLANILYAIPDYTNKDEFLDRSFFTQNLDRLLGNEILTTNQYGKQVYVTKKFEGDKTNEDVLSHIKDLPVIDFDFWDNIKKIPYITDVSETKDIVGRIQNDIDKGKEPQTEIVTGDVISFAQSVRLYNNKLSRLEIEAYLYCYPQENKAIWIGDEQYKQQEISDSISEITLNKGFENECTISIPTVIFTGEKNEYFSLFLHGDIYSKRKKIEENKDTIIEIRGEEYYNTLITSFDSIKSVEISFDNEDYTKRPYISPTSDFANKFKIDTFAGDERSYPSPLTLTSAFVAALGSSWYKSSRYEGVKYTSIIDVMKGKRLIDKPYSGKDKDLSPREKQLNEEADLNNSIETDKTSQQMYIVFSDFIKESIDEDSKKKLTDILTEFNNKFTFTELEKVPVGFTHSSRFKNKNFFKLTNVQRNAVAFLNINKSGLLAYDVGVGKTAALLMAVSNRFDTGNAKKALIVVPASVHKKWIGDTKDMEVEQVNPVTKQKEKVMMRGALNHLNVVDLGNLNDDMVMGLKDYSAEELAKIENTKKDFEEFKNELIENIVNFDSATLDNDEEDEELGSGDVGLEKSSEETFDQPAKGVIAFSKDDTNLKAKKDLLDELLKKTPIEVFQQFGITNEENKTINRVYDVIKDNYDNDTLNPNHFSIYKSLGVAKGSKIDFYKIPEYIHLSAIVNMLYVAYKNLASYFISIFGTIKQFPDKTIFFASYPALLRLGFKEETIEMMSDELLRILYGSDIDSKKMAEYQIKISKLFTNSVYKAKILFEDFGFDLIGIDEAHNMKNLITSVTKSDDEDREDVSYGRGGKKGNVYGGTNQENEIKGGKVSSRALIAFMMSMYVQLNNRGNNSYLLTATPFTNSPLEIYSMLTLSKYDYMKTIGYETVKTFVDDFIKLKTELSYTVQGTVTAKVEPIGYNNLNLLKRIIFTIMDFKTGEEAMVRRPCKVVLPIKEKTTICDTFENLKFIVDKPITTITIPTYEQQLIFDALQRYLLSQIDKKSVDTIFYEYIQRQGGETVAKYLMSNIQDTDAYNQTVAELFNRIHTFFNTVEDKNGEVKEVDKLMSSIAILKTLAAFRNVSITPFMFRPFTEMMGLDDKTIDTKDIIEKSSKLMLTVGCIKKANKIFDENKMPRKCFVIYSNLGTKVGKNSPISLLKRLKEYFLDDANGFGYGKNTVTDTATNKKYSEVEILDGTTSKDKKVALMKLFNEGQIKIIITTVREGVDLQGNTIGLFNLSVDWNPTDAKQIEGRSWRQGNKNAYCIISYPLTANSSDLSIYQKLQDKTARLKAVWDRSNVQSQFDLGEFNPEEMKMNMISRVDKLAPFLYMDEMAMLKGQYRLLVARLEEDEKIISDYEQFNNNVGRIRNALHLLTRLPKAIDIVNKTKSLTREYNDYLSDIDIFKEELEDAEKEAPSYDEWQNLIANETTINNNIIAKGQEMTPFVINDDEENIKKIKNEIIKLKKDIEQNKTAINLAKKKVDEEAKEKVKEINDKIKKAEKDAEKVKEKIDELTDINNFKPYGDEKFVPEFQPTEILGTNYFEKSAETGKYKYKSKEFNLQNIDWYKATIEDLFVGIERVVDAYKNETGLYTAFIEYGRYDRIDIPEINEKFNNFLNEEIVSDLEEMYGSVYPSNFISLATELLRGTYVQKYNLKYYALKIVSIKRALKEYAAIIGESTADEYLSGLRQKVVAMKEEVGNDSITNIPDSVIKKYLDKADDIISERRKEYGNFIALIDAYATLKDIMKVPFPEEVAMVHLNNETEQIIEDVEAKVIDDTVEEEIKEAVEDEIKEIYEEKPEETTKPEKKADLAENLRTMIAGLQLMSKRAKDKKKSTNIKSMIKGLELMLKRAEKKACGGIMKQGGELINWAAGFHSPTIKYVEFKKKEYTVKVDVKTLDVIVDINEDGFDTVNQYAISDVINDWSQFYWGYEMHPENKVELYKVLDILKCKYSKDRMESALSGGKYFEGGEVVGMFVELGAEPNTDFPEDTHEGSIKIPKEIKYVKDYKEASDTVRKFIVDNDLGGGNFAGFGDIYIDGKKIGRVSYNGKVWDNDDNEIKINFNKGGGVSNDDYLEQRSELENKIQTLKMRLAKAKKKRDSYAGNDFHTHINYLKIDKNEVQPLLDELKKISDKYNYGFSKGGNVKYDKGVELLKSAQANNHDEVYDILNEKWKQYKIVNSREWDLETPYSRGWVENGNEIQVMLLKKDDKYYWDWKEIKKHAKGGGVNQKDVNIEIKTIEGKYRKSYVVEAGYKNMFKENKSFSDKKEAEQYAANHRYKDSEYIKLYFEAKKMFDIVGETINRYKDKQKYYDFMQIVEDFGFDEDVSVGIYPSAVHDLEKNELKDLIDELKNFIAKYKINYAELSAKYDSRKWYAYDFESDNDMYFYNDRELISYALKRTKGVVTGVDSAIKALKTVDINVKPYSEKL